VSVDPLADTVAQEENRKAAVAVMGQGAISGGHNADAVHQEEEKHSEYHNFKV